MKLKRITTEKLGIILLTILVFSPNNTYSQEEVLNSPIRNEIFSIGGGLGMDYSILGGKLNYFATKDIGIILSISPFGTFNGGIDLKLRKLQTNRIMPYLVILYGRYAQLNRNEGFNHGFSIGGGIKYWDNFKNFGYFNFGLSYRLITDHGNVWFWPFVPTVGYAFVLKSTKQ